MSAVNSRPLLLGDDGYQISRSVRLRSGTPSYLSRTPASAGNRTTWTWSAWLKRGNLSTQQGIFSAQAAVGVNPICRINFGAADLLTLTETNGSGVTLYSITPNTLYRDPSAWYHFVFVYDSTNATSTERLRMYINGIRETSFSSVTYPSLNQQSLFNSATAHQLGRLAANDTTSAFDGFLTEVNFIDGQALTASSFGEINTITNVWQPKKYSGTYGTNGFYVNFSDNSAATATTIGKDYSGNNNNWTPSGISVTAGVAYDSMLDVPTTWADGGNGRGNYCTLNPLDKGLSNITLVNTNLAASVAAVNVGVRGTIGISTGKWYWEVTHTTVGGTSIFGIADAPWPLTYVGSTATSYGYGSNANKFSNAVSTAYGATLTTNDVVGIAFDASAGTIEFYKNNVSQGVAYTGIPSGTYFPAISGQTGAVLTANFGQRPFAYAPPTGFKALNTQNLLDPTILNSKKYFDVSLWTGNGTTQNIVNSASMQPDFIWTKSRSAVTSHYLVDAVRGVTKTLFAQLTNAETTSTNVITAFNSNGFSIGNDAGINTNAATYVGWQWKAGNTVVTNTAGSISSQVLANVLAGVSVITYTGTGVNATVGHGLGVAPKMVVVKLRNTAGTNWNVLHTSLIQPNILYLNSNGVQASTPTAFNSTNPTSSVFSIGTAAGTNTSGGTHIAYAFSEVAGFSAFGGYTGNGSGDGPFIYCGFSPEFVMIKSTTVTGANWAIFDTLRDPYNVADSYLIPNSANAETVTATLAIDIVSNGFKCRGAQGTINASAAGYIYMAFAKNPFKTALAR